MPSTHNVFHKSVLHVQPLRRRSSAYFLWQSMGTVILVVIAIIIHEVGLFCHLATRAFILQIATAWELLRPLREPTFFFTLL